MRDFEVDRRDPRQKKTWPLRDRMPELYVLCMRKVFIVSRRDIVTYLTLIEDLFGHLFLEDLWDCLALQILVLTE